MLMCDAVDEMISLGRDRARRFDVLVVWDHRRKGVAPVECEPLISYLFSGRFKKDGGHSELTDYYRRASFVARIVMAYSALPVLAGRIIVCRWCSFP